MRCAQQKIDELAQVHTLHRVYTTWLMARRPPSLGGDSTPRIRRDEWPVVFPAFRPFAVVVEARR